MPTGIYNHFKIRGNNNPAKRLEVRKKISEANKGKKYVLGKHWKLSEETKKKMRKPKSEEAKRKMSKAKKGKSFRHSGSFQKGHKINVERKCSKESKQKMREAAFEYAKKVVGIICPRIGRNEIQLLDKLEKELGYRIIRQFLCGGYYLDGYIPEINLVIEVDEKYHENNKEKDIKREEFIKAKLGCQFLRIKEYD